MRFITVLLVALLGLVHAELWLARGGVPRTLDLQNRIERQRSHNLEAKARNALLVAEVGDLQEGLEMVEEKARFELGMVKPDEIYVQVATPKR